MNWNGGTTSRPVLADGRLYREVGRRQEAGQEAEVALEPSASRQLSASRKDEPSGAGIFICHLTVLIGHFLSIFVSVRVISWIVLFSLPGNDPRNLAKHDEMGFIQ